MGRAIWTWGLHSQAGTGMGEGVQKYGYSMFCQIEDGVMMRCGYISVIDDIVYMSI